MNNNSNYNDNLSNDTNNSINNNSRSNQNMNATPNSEQTNNPLNRNQLNRSLNNQPNFPSNRPHNNPSRMPNNDLAKPVPSNSNLPSNNANNRSGNLANNKSAVKKAGNDLANKALNKMGPKGKLASMALNKLKGKSGNDDNTEPSLFKRKRGLGPGGLLAGLTGGNQEESSESNDNDSSSEVQDDGADIAETVGKASRIVLLLIKLAPILIPAILIAVLIFVVIAVMENPMGAAMAALGLDTHNTSNPSYIYDLGEDPELGAAEREYYDKLYETIDAYQEGYGVSLNKYLLHSAIVFRYYMSNDGNAFTDDSGITEEDLENAIENTTSTDDEEDPNKVEVDYTDATNKIGVVAALMIEEGANGTYTTDSEANGPIYENFVNSDFITTYYADFLYNDSQEAKEKVVDNIFAFAEMMDLVMNGEPKSMVISGESIVYMQTCAYSYNYKTINNIRVYDNPLTNEGTDYPAYLSITDYIKGVLMTEVGSYISEEYSEGLKALSIVALSFMLHDNNSGFNLKTGEMYFPSGNCRQVACDPNNGCSYLYGMTSGRFGTAFVGLNRFGSTTGQHPPLTEEENVFLDEILGAIFGKVIVKSGVTSDTFRGSSDVVNLHHYASLEIDDCVAGYCMGQKEAMADAANGLTYMQILEKYFYNVDYDVIDIQEGLYHVTSGTYNGTIQLNEEFHYHQGDSPWGSVDLCGSGDISANGCNITSAAIAISLLTNQRVTPLDLNNRQNNISTCSSTSRPQMIMDFARLYGLTPTAIKKSDSAAVEDMLSKLATGNYVAIARLAANGGRYKTSSGHYIAIVGVKTENGSTKLLVWDPGSRSSSRDNYWADLNYDILEYLRDSYSFILIGR